MQQDEHIEIWHHSLVHVLDIRHQVMQSNEQLFTYQLPTSGFLYTVRGEALLLVDSTVYSVRGFHLIHAGKGAQLNIQVSGSELEYYLVLYKAVMPLSGTSANSRKAGVYDLYQMQYHFVPHQPLSLYSTITRMSMHWQQQSKMEQFHVKALFYQWVYDLVGQLHAQDIAAYLPAPDLISMCIQYMQENYSKSITLESLAEVMNCSHGHLSNRFKQTFNCGPIDWLIRLRMERAKELLRGTDAALKEIAQDVGYADVYYFSRVFKKHTGYSPGKWKMKQVESENNLLNRGRNEIVAQKPNCYIDSDNYYQYKRGGFVPVQKVTRSSLAVSLLLTFTLLLSACGGTAITTTGNTTSPTSGAAQPLHTSSPNSGGTSSNPDHAATEGKVRIVSTIMGNVEVPVNPTRVVTDYYLGDLLALGITPIGTYELYKKSPYLQEGTADIVDIGESLEAVIDLNPDLIITGDREKYEAFSKIAPTVLIPNNLGMYEELSEFGRVLNKKSEVEAWLATYEQRVASARQSIQDIVGKDETVTVIDSGDKGGVNLFGNGYTGRSFYEGLGLIMPDTVQQAMHKKDQQWQRISLEVLAKYAGDRVFVAVGKTEDKIDYKKAPVWSKLAAVQNDHLYEIDGWRFWFSDPISILGQVEEVAKMIIERAKK
ncbi:AraC family transcriptional regulator [Paenibacillus sp. ACRRX]|uniref:AraC family transcriptional regulator n=1 Tax=Paenibacillus sp. ACRRX TaxID=2918206 RepID=UPI001EF63840|nr:AraC family transcriptional regulator [Paenibacillus sp. ACRRX]MCG7405933.1 AraC family transcriptional regulator [Paenibacillus sp. ACRRX]